MMRLATGIAGMPARAIARRSRTGSLLFAAIGFGFVTVGTLLEAVYQFGLEETYFLTGLELLRLQAIEKSALAVGLFALLYSLVRLQ